MRTESEFHKAGYTISRFRDFPLGPSPPTDELTVRVDFVCSAIWGKHIQKGIREMSKGCHREARRLSESQTYKMLRHRAEVSDFRQANAEKRRAFMAGAIRYDDPLKDERGYDREDASLSDRGKGAEIVYMLDRQPEWFDEMVKVLKELKGVERDVVNALFQDLRPQVAARLAGVNRQRVYRVRDSLRQKLARAHELWLRRFE